MKPNIRLHRMVCGILLILINLSALAQNQLVNPQQAIINGSELRVGAAEIGKRLLYNNRPLPLGVAHDFVLKKLFTQGQNVIVLVAVLSGGTVCPAVHRFITFEYTRTLISEGFGNCLMEFNAAYQQDQQIIVEFAATETKSATAFIYDAGQISIRTAGVEATPRRTPPNRSSVSPPASSTVVETTVTPSEPPSDQPVAETPFTKPPQSIVPSAEWVFANRQVTVTTQSLKVVLSCDSNALTLYIEQLVPSATNARDLLPGTFKLDDREFHMEFRSESNTSRWRADRTRHLNWNSPFVDLLIRGKTLSINFAGQIQPVSMTGSARAIRALQSACAL